VLAAVDPHGGDRAVEPDQLAAEVPASSSGRRVSMRTTRPTAAAKSFSRASTRSSPGEETSSR